MAFLQPRTSENASVQVAVRTRPLNQRENGTNSIITTKGSTIYIKDPETNKNKTFNYDYAYSEDSTQEELHNDIGTYVINNAFSGYNTCVFAYGQTGCFAAGTKIMTADGRYKLVEDVKIGDVLMGDDSTSRNVLRLFHGQQDMYKISSDKAGHTSYTVNADHILLFEIYPHITCKWINKKNHWVVNWFDAVSEEVRKGLFPAADETEAAIKHAKNLAEDFAATLPRDIYILEKTAVEYFRLSKFKKKYYALYTSGVEFDEASVELDPYSLGVYLSGPAEKDIKNNEDDTVENTENNNIETATLHHYNVWNNRHIPDAYKYNSREIRLQLLAGLINGNGHYDPISHIYKITNINTPSVLADDILYLTRSLGFYAEVATNGYNTSINISGDNIRDIPVIVPCGDQDFLTHHVRGYLTLSPSSSHTFVPTIEHVGIGTYYGFMLDGNHRFIGADFNVLRNSGKSHSVMGSDEQPGLIPRICRELFKRQESHNGADIHDASINYKVEVSYLEIYSEDVRDLLSRTPQQGLKVREHPKFGPYIEGLQQILVERYETIKKLIDQGNKERVTASTLMNQRSSRSHAILTLYFTQLVEEPGLGKPREIVSKINLVDLAGSERVEMSGVTGINFKEAININKSLSTLGLVINKLAMQSQSKLQSKSADASPSDSPILKPSKKQLILSPGTKSTRLSSTPTSSSRSITSTSTNTSSSPKGSSDRSINTSSSPKGSSDRSINTSSSPKGSSDRSIVEHVPYRDSVLTWILKESLGGNSKTFMIATISPSEINYNESLSTLRYAANAKQIVNTVKVNEDPNDKLIRLLKDEIDDLKRKLLVGGSDSTSSAEDLKKLRDEIVQREELMREKDKSWEQKFEESKYMNDQVQEQLKKEFKKKLEMANSEREALLKEMETIKTGISSSDIKQQKELEEEFQKKQADFEKGRIIGTAVTLQEYYEKKLEKLRDDYEQRTKEHETMENTKAIKDINELKDTNIKLKEDLNRNQRDLQQQIRQFTTDRLILSKQIQQLHNKIHTLEQGTPLIPLALLNPYTSANNSSNSTSTTLTYTTANNSITGDEEKYQMLQLECNQLDTRINSNKDQLMQLEQKHAAILKDVEVKQADLDHLKSEYTTMVEKFAADKSEYDVLITKKEQLHTEIVTLQCNLDIQVEIAKEKLKNPTIEDLLKIKDCLAQIFDSLTTHTA